jgi:hypothetical protein
MRTTAHLPADLLALVDRRARELGISRNRYVVRGVERALATETEWSATFVAELAEAGDDLDGRRELENLRAAVAAARTRKGSPGL